MLITNVYEHMFSSSLIVQCSLKTKFTALMFTLILLFTAVKSIPWAKKK